MHKIYDLAHTILHKYHIVYQFIVIRFELLQYAILLIFTYGNARWNYFWQKTNTEMMYFCLNANYTRRKNAKTKSFFCLSSSCSLNFVWCSIFFCFLSLSSFQYRFRCRYAYVIFNFLFVYFSIRCHIKAFFNCH